MRKSERSLGPMLETGNGRLFEYLDVEAQARANSTILQWPLSTQMAASLLLTAVVTIESKCSLVMELSSVSLDTMERETGTSIILLEPLSIKTVVSCLQTHTTIESKCSLVMELSSVGLEPMEMETVSSICPTESRSIKEAASSSQTLTIIGSKCSLVMVNSSLSLEPMEMETASLTNPTESRSIKKAASLLLTM